MSSAYSPLVDVEINIRELFDSYIIDDDSYSDWLLEFKDKLEDMNIEKTVKYSYYTLTLQVTIFTDIAEIGIICEDDALVALKTDKELQAQCIKQINELLHEYNERLAKEDIAQIPNTRFYWKDSKFYIEVLPGQKSLDIDFTSIQFIEEVDENDIDWSYLL